MIGTGREILDAAGQIRTEPPIISAPVPRAIRQIRSVGLATSHSCRTTSKQAHDPQQPSQLPELPT